MKSTKIDLIIEYLGSSYRLMMSHLDNLGLEDALIVPDGGCRSILGTLKHAAAAIEWVGCRRWVGCAGTTQADEYVYNY